jgi:hypothetical protein
MPEVNEYMRNAFDVKPADIRFVTGNKTFEVKANGAAWVFVLSRAVLWF